MKEQNKLIVADKGWAESAPNWLLKEIEVERLIGGFDSLMDKGKETVGDAEACLYLFTLSLGHPMSHNYSQIYIYLSTKLMEKRGVKIPEEVAVRELSEDSKRELKELKYTLYRRRGGEIKSPLFETLKKLKKI